MEKDRMEEDRMEKDRIKKLSRNACYMMDLIKNDEMDMVRYICEIIGEDVEFNLCMISGILCYEKYSMLEMLLSNSYVDLSVFKRSNTYYPDEKYDRDIIWNPLFRVIKENNLDLIQLFLRYGFSLEYEDYYGRTALHIAVKFGSLRIVQYLISMGANKEARGCGKTPLLVAVLNHKLEIVSYLCDSGCDLDAIYYDHITSLSIAIFDGSYEIVQKLIQSGANLYIMNPDGDTLINIATRYKRFDIIQLLLDYY